MYSLKMHEMSLNLHKLALIYLHLPCHMELVGFFRMKKYVITFGTEHFA